MKRTVTPAYDYCQVQLLDASELKIWRITILTPTRLVPEEPEKLLKRVWHLEVAMTGLYMFLTLHHQHKNLNGNDDLDERERDYMYCLISLCIRNTGCFSVGFSP